MSEIQIMNSEMLEILKNYFEICSFFNDRLEEIKADEVLNINLELLKASITDLNINIANFKSDLQYNERKNNPDNQVNLENKTNTTNHNQNNNSLENYTELDNRNMLATFFMYLMKIDKDSILNNPAIRTSNSIGTLKNQNQPIQPIHPSQPRQSSLFNTQDDCELD